MPHIGELVGVVAPADPDWKCPFPHDPRKHNKKNVLPPNEKNDSKKLCSSLDNESLHLDPIPIRLKSGKKHLAQFSAHHVLPGNETWKRTKLHRWIDTLKGHVLGDIGYDVNDATNGIDLPSNAAVKGWGGKSKAFQLDYAILAMEADKKTRQFHDRHAAYSDFALKVLDKIAAKLNGKKPPGCGDEDCTGGKKGPKYDPPYKLLEVIEGVASRLRGRLQGAPRSWREPIYTSRFALAYRNGITADRAREMLEKARESLSQVTL